MNAALKEVFVPNIKEIKAVSIALLAIGFKSESRGMVFVLFDQFEQIILPIHKSNARSFQEVADLIGAHTFCTKLTPSDRLICAKANLALNEHLNNFIEAEETSQMANS